MSSPVRHISPEGFQGCDPLCVRCILLSKLDAHITAYVGKLPLAKEEHQLDAYDEIMTVVKRTFDLSDRETEVTELLIMGLSNRDIAKSLKLQENTIKVYVREVLKKLGVDSRSKVPFAALKTMRRRTEG